MTHQKDNEMPSSKALFHLLIQLQIPDVLNKFPKKIEKRSKFIEKLAMAMKISCNCELTLCGKKVFF